MQARCSIFTLLSALTLISCKGPQGPAGPPGSSDDLTNPNIMPHVIFTLPSTGGTGPYTNLYSPGNWGNPHFIVRFNKYMRTASLDGAVSIQGYDCPVRVSLLRIIWWPREPQQGSWNDFYDDLFLFTVSDSLYYVSPPYRIQRSYTVRVESGIEDINGNRTAAPYSFSFTPEPYFRVAKVFPENGANNVPTTYTVPTLYFNSSVD